MPEDTWKDCGIAQQIKRGKNDDLRPTYFTPTHHLENHMLRLKKLVSKQTTKHIYECILDQTYQNIHKWSYKMIKTISVEKHFKITFKWNQMNTFESWWVVKHKALDLI